MFPVPEVKLLTDDLLAHAQRDGVTLFGAGNFARDVAKALLVLVYRCMPTSFPTLR